MRAGSRLGRSILDCCSTPRKASQGRGGVLKPKWVIGAVCVSQELPNVSVVLSRWLGSKASWLNGMMNFRSRAWGPSSMTPLVVGNLQRMPSPQPPFFFHVTPVVLPGRTSWCFHTLTFCWDVKLQALQSTYIPTKVKDKTICKTMMHT